MLSFVIVSVIMLNATYKPFVLNFVMLSVVRLNVVMLSVVAPTKHSSLLQTFVSYDRKRFYNFRLSNKNKTFNDFDTWNEVMGPANVMETDQPLVVAVAK
jgi:hypothetical protein